MTYSDLKSHESMVFDDVRNAAYLEAMRRVITPDSVVLDLGAGVGILGLLAAKLGARRVYCVEPSPVLNHVAALAKANGVGDRVVPLRGRIEDVTIPEPVDVLVSVFTGNLLFNEGLLPSLWHARDRYLKPGGAMIPDRARLLMCAAEAPAAYRDNVENFRREALGLDFAGVTPSLANGFYRVERGDAAPRPLTEPAIVADIDFHTTHEESVRWSASQPVVAEGRVHGVLGWIEIQLGEAWLSTGPDQPNVHWRPLLLPVGKPIDVQAGQVLDLGYRYVDDAQVFWSIAADGQRQQHSRVLGNSDFLINVSLSSAACANPLRREGLFVSEALAMMVAGQSNQAIADALWSSMPAHFRDAADALRRVGDLAARYRSHPGRPA